MQIYQVILLYCWLSMNNKSYEVRSIAKSTSQVTNRSIEPKWQGRTRNVERASTRRFELRIEPSNGDSKRRMKTRSVEWRLKASNWDSKHNHSRRERQIEALDQNLNDQAISWMKLRTEVRHQFECKFDISSSVNSTSVQVWIQHRLKCIQKTLSYV